MCKEKENKILEYYRDDLYAELEYDLAYLVKYIKSGSGVEIDCNNSDAGNEIELFMYKKEKSSEEEYYLQSRKAYEIMEEHDALCTRISYLKGKYILAEIITTNSLEDYGTIGLGEMTGPAPIHLYDMNPLDQPAE
ncbi:MAG: hypothetical protein CMI60_17405 [Parvibaculum sp.]|nr:hypothetical protein [Parvibaculum sp.]